MFDIEVWNWGGIADEMIGATSISIEDRWFSKAWRQMKLKPVEERSLFNPRSKSVFGKIGLWIDIFDSEQTDNNPMIKLSNQMPKIHSSLSLVPPKRDV